MPKGLPFDWRKLLFCLRCIGEGDIWRSFTRVPGKTWTIVWAKEWGWIHCTRSLFEGKNVRSFWFFYLGNWILMLIWRSVCIICNYNLQNSLNYTTSSVFRTWIAISDRKDEGNWVYESDSGALEYTHWQHVNYGRDRGEFNTANDCAYIYGDSLLQWITTYCHYTYRYICEPTNWLFSIFDMIYNTK